MKAPVEDITRACFLSGLQPHKWISLVKASLQQSGISSSLSNPEQEICGALLNIPADFRTEMLIDYLRVALLDGLLGLPVLIPNVLSTYRSPNIEHLSHLSALAQLILDAHYTSPNALSISILSVQDALSILHTVYLPPGSPFDRLVQPISQLVLVLLSCVHDLPEATTAHAADCYTICSDILQIYQLPPDIRTSLETFLMSLGLLLGDEAKTSREAEVIHSTPMTSGRHNVVNPGAGVSVSAVGLLIHHLILNRGTSAGCGNDSVILSAFLAYFRAASLTLATFYMQIFLSIIDSVVQSVSHHKTHYVTCSFFFGRLPRLIKKFEHEVKAELGLDDDLATAAEAALIEIFRSKGDLLEQCDFVLQSISQNQEQQLTQPFRDQFLVALVKFSVISEALVSSLLSGNEVLHINTIAADATEANLDTESYILSRFSPDLTPDEYLLFFNRASLDYGAHHILAEVVSSTLISCAKIADLDQLYQMTKVMLLDDRLLDLVSLHVSITDIVAHCLIFLEEFDCNIVGDPQSAMTHLGSVVIFVQTTAYRYQLRAHAFSVGDRICNTGFLKLKYRIHQPLRLKYEDSTFAAWANALFDQSSEGIEDNLLRTTKLETLLQLAPSLISYAIAAMQNRLIDGDVSRSGISYFLSGLLNWTLAGAINSLISDILRLGYNTPLHFEVLNSLVKPDGTGCPSSVLILCGHSLARLLSDRRMESVRNKLKFNDASLRQALEPTFKAQNTAAAANSTKNIWPSLPRFAVRRALAMASASNSPKLNLATAVQGLGPVAFLNMLWAELSAAASMGDLVGPRQIGLFVLTATLPPPYPSLLPLFLTHTVPALISIFKIQESPVQIHEVELLAALIASALVMTLHCERVLLLQFNQPVKKIANSSQLARGIIAALTKEGTSTSALLLRQILSFPSFATHFSFLPPS